MSDESFVCEKTTVDNSQNNIGMKDFMAYLIERSGVKIDNPAIVIIKAKTY